MKAITLMIAVAVVATGSVSHASLSTAAPVCNQKLAGRMMDKTASDYKTAKNTSSSGSTKTKTVKGIQGS
ncbi:hypothetical protein [Bdellovibrio sp. KM01]|uniref:hypothetical protein n=1 Tax=Bdellovibrio sp. KM01 TaxID=2748865 RepID=UPI0015EAE403|nr:hypothetical protein [Bdellovibrio sp. KM01]QLY25590.1 hypothetical protein HW988_00610 [Bdellovibrio sp. KM01]